MDGVDEWIGAKISCESVMELKHEPTAEINLQEGHLSLPPVAGQLRRVFPSSSANSKYWRGISLLPAEAIARRTDSKFKNPNSRISLSPP
ncbi:hypothetical protein ACLOJK_006971 [Asimina triloba]